MEQIIVRRNAMAGSFLLSFFLALLSALVAGCQKPAKLPPIEQMAQPPSIRLNYHIAARDDSLYSIAWRYGVDARELAQRNRIAAPYRLHAGQKIMLAESDSATRLAESRAVSTPRGVKVTAVQDDQPVVEVASSTASTSSGVREVSTPQTSGTNSAATSSAAASTTVALGSSGQWLWPTNGRVITLFSANDPLRKGIDLEGKQGDPVKAAGSGSVVYAGSGLAGYGELLIIKHDDQFLSAYGHNSKLLVAEGDTVKKGQVIAHVGSTGADKTKLHFEIRKAGKPVDPLLYLPRR